ncbi:DUF4236 domain-containing protein [Cereibacter sphaeroides]|uniref:DUF4236 domain-containing protein n=1 Tax=Cereibacter sphaeroides TaxID=1063 RepID=UPI001F24AB3A|nr:DUF4236 domain-containing protein [Cereibacter sphaeroides]MCE6959604.1 DUF4236 domain-containing protein [Cereibacter sphaeroides]MCE6974536.1 DUF4236 domain-containing protein [Cereibacter sphaeroides]
MGFRFSKRISIIPGVKLNVGLRGASATIGGRGASVNIGKKGAYANASLPGTGISYRQKIGGTPSQQGSAGAAGGGSAVVGILVIFALIGLGILIF